MAGLLLLKLSVLALTISVATATTDTNRKKDLSGNPSNNGPPPSGDPADSGAGKNRCSGKPRNWDECYTFHNGTGVCAPVIKLPHGHWECQGVCDPFPPDVLNANYTIDGDPLPELVVYLENTFTYYQCLTGYGSTNPYFMYSVCLVDSTWLVPAFECLEECGPATTSYSNSFIYSYTGILEGDTAIVVCNGGFEALGPMAMRCANGEWQPEGNGECVAICLDDPPSVPYAAISYDGGYLSGSIVVYECEEDYTTNGCIFAVCDEEGGDWDWELFMDDPCLEDCGMPDPDHFDNANLNWNNQNVHDGQLVYYQCDLNAGYVSGTIPPYAECVASGGNRHYVYHGGCVYDCGPLPEDGLVLVSGEECEEYEGPSVEGATVCVECPAGQYSASPMYYICDGDAQEWQLNGGPCIEITTPTPTTTPSPTPTTTPSPTPTTTPTPTSTTTPPPTPTTTPASACGEPEVSSDLQVTDYNATHAQVECAVGFVYVDGNQPPVLIECNEDTGLWTDPDLICAGEGCDIGITVNLPNNVKIAQIGGGCCYWPTPSQGNFNESRDTCDSQGGILLYFISQAEANMFYTVYFGPVHNAQQTTSFTEHWLHYRTDSSSDLYFPPDTNLQIYYPYILSQIPPTNLQPDQCLKYDDSTQIYRSDDCVNPPQKAKGFCKICVNDPYNYNVNPL